MTARGAAWLAALAGCVPAKEQPSDAPHAQPSASDARSMPGDALDAAVDGGGSLPPLAAESWLVRLPLEGFEDGYVSVPLGATGPRPVMIALHGSADRPEWACGSWRGVSDAFPFILCPSGIAAPGGGGAMTYRDTPSARRELEAGLAALRGRFGAHVADGPMVYAGYSRGAYLGVPMLADTPDRFPYAILGEGGHTSWWPDRLERFVRGGGRRVLFVCSTRSCEVEAERARARLQRAGLESRVASAGDIGHLLDGRVVEAMRPHWPWLVAGDPRFARPD